MTSAYKERMRRISERNREMKRLRADGWTLRKLAKRYRMSFQRVGMIVKETA